MGTEDKERKIVYFELGGEGFGIDIKEIKEIINYQKVTYVPKLPVFIEGVVNLRGVVIPIIDLRKRFDLDAERSSERKIIIVSVGGRIVGLVVSKVTSITTVSNSDLLASPKMVQGVEADYIEGAVETGEDLILLLNLSKILTAEEKLKLESPADV